MTTESIRARKRELRAEVLAGRLALLGAGVGLNGATRHLPPLLAALRAALRATGRQPVVAAYLPLADEPDPGSGEWAGVTVLLPLLQPDASLRWAVAGGERPGPRGTREPTGAIQPGGLAVADLVVVPALAADVTGARLGRGGGSYDRALAQVRPGIAVVALLADDAELRGDVPVAEHDRRVTAVATPTAVLGVRT